ncbi:MAG: hypothetical protein NC131_01015 [Roseburia sp.]|nr:hypothetical protein [Roseburia sp.]
MTAKPRNTIEEQFNGYDSSISLARGGWTSLYAGKDENDKVVMYGYGDGRTDYYYPKYCPECGCKLRVRQQNSYLTNLTKTVDKY